ncbi:hypothetical protein [Atopomonas sediminilitoris]|uniref:hypothetical protein n=1 Tax=Atopomonas sediminilitoris TaxID=2919919 RepID=UPI001F4E3921|nr:hypothetical protein [Atopomonas sediminilitoris]MCJ8169459.1 hypothetical protein [Atopomonas sediminilitoris]
MAYDFGSQTLGIRNPFRVEGALIALRGGLTLALGLYCLLQVAQLVDGRREVEGWLHAGVGLGLLIWGLIATGNGLLKVFRFYVGRNVPASLAKNQADSDAKHHLSYTASELQSMLMGRKNTTFQEPQSLFARLVHTLIPRLLFLPPAYRGLAENLLFGLSMTLFMLMTFALAWFAGATGLARLEGTPVMAWLGCLLALYLFKLWFSMRDPLRHFSRGGLDIGLSRIGIIIFLAILLPVALVYVHHHVQRIPALPVNPTPLLLMTLTMALLTCALGLFLLVQRLSTVNPSTEVSEHRDNWQRNLVPRELFIRLETHILANRRHQEIPNRLYQKFSPEMIEEGGRDKGSFKGRTLVETQPVVQEMKHSAAFRAIRLVSCVIGQLLLAAGAIWLVSILGTLAKVTYQPQNLMSLSYPILLFLFGLLIGRMSNLFWAELQFRSLLLDLSIEGTYTESKLSTGQSIYDSTRSENIVVRSTITPWFLLSELLTSTFARSGNMNLEQPRHVLSFEKSNETLTAVLDEIEDFFKTREAIAGINEVDLKSASQIYQMNEQTRAIGHPAKASLEHEQAAAFVRHSTENTDTESKLPES